jgi:hypothetical protein
MKENITAQWAKETATNLLNDKIKNQISKALDSIETSVKRNEFSCTHYGILHDLAIEDIKSRGFGITKHGNYNQMDGDSYSITWK